MYNGIDIQIGDKTQTHFHVITPQSFNTMNAIVKRPMNPIPPDAVVVVFDMIIDFYLLLIYIFLC